MIVTKTAIGVGVAIYIALWFVALNGANRLIPLLAVPLILVVLVGAGTLMQDFIGIPGRSPKFRKPDDDDEEK